MADRDHEHDQNPILDLVDDSVTNPHTIEVFETRQPLAAWWSRVSSETVEAPGDSLLRLSRELSKLLFGGRFQSDFVRH